MQLPQSWPSRGAQGKSEGGRGNKIKRGRCRHDDPGPITPSPSSHMLLLTPRRSDTMRAPFSQQLHWDGRTSPTLVSEWPTSDRRTSCFGRATEKRQSPANDGTRGEEGSHRWSLRVSALPSAPEQTQLREQQQCRVERVEVIHSAALIDSACAHICAQIQTGPMQGNIWRRVRSQRSQEVPGRWGAA